MYKTRLTLELSYHNKYIKDEQLPLFLPPVSTNFDPYKDFMKVAGVSAEDRIRIFPLIWRKVLLGNLKLHT